MFAAVVPVYNEESRIGRLLRRLLALGPLTQIFVIQNGSNPATRAEVYQVYQANRQRIRLIHFEEPLGIDVPRAVGAKLAYAGGAAYALFVDGDLAGEITRELTTILSKTARLRPDLALINCYPQKPVIDSLNEPLFYFRRLLSEELGLAGKIGIASPSHGPHLVSRRMLALVPWEDFCVPPTLLTHAVLQNLTVSVVGAIPHIRLGSQIKSSTHSQLIVDTIAGDCLEALCLFYGRPRSRSHGSKIYLGYHRQRRIDLLHTFLSP